MHFEPPRRGHPLCKRLHSWPQCLYLEAPLYIYFIVLQASSFWKRKTASCMACETIESSSFIQYTVLSFVEVCPLSIRQYITVKSAFHNSDWCMQSLGTKFWSNAWLVYVGPTVAECWEYECQWAHSCLEEGTAGGQGKIASHTHKPHPLTAVNWNWVIINWPWINTNHFIALSIFLNHRKSPHQNQTPKMSS